MTPKIKISNLIVRLASFYPHGPTGTELERIAREWQRELSCFAPDVLEDAIGIVRKERPNFFPTLGQLEAACKTLVARQDDERQRQSRDRNDRLESQAHADYIAKIPADPELQERWINGGANASERLGRSWAVESKRRGLSSDFRHPPNVIQQRLRALFRAMDSNN